jgi:transposase InsO family protein
MSFSRTASDQHTGELTPVVIVTDNGPAYRSVGFARCIDSRPELLHVRTRHRSPQTNGVIERFYQAIKYETCTGTRSATAWSWLRRWTPI